MKYQIEFRARHKADWFPLEIEPFDTEEAANAAIISEYVAYQRVWEFRVCKCW